MHRYSSILVLGAAFCLIPMMSEDRFVTPEFPLEEAPAAPSQKVTNGVAYESGSIPVLEGQTLQVPSDAVVEEYPGATVRCYLTKSLHCSGHPPTPMRIADARHYLGIAYQSDDKLLTIATFGEWRNRGGVAGLRLLVLVPKGQAWQHIENHSGLKSPATKKMDFSDDRTKDCYWYAGIGPADGWTPVSTDLQYNRFLEK